MPWNTTNTVVIDKVKEMGAVPALDSVLRDGDWMWVLRSWSFDYAEGGDEVPYRAANFLADLVNLHELSQLYPTYVAVGAGMQLAFSDDLVQRTDNAADGLSAEPEQTVRDDLYAEAYAMLAPYADTFTVDVTEVQTHGSVGVSQPVAQALTRDRIDRSVVDAYNDSILKNLDKGEYCSYEQSGDIVFLEPAGLDAVAPGYRAWIADADGHSQGHVQMVSKGRALDPGEIRVTGTRDRDAFKTAIRPVTRKKMTFA